MFDGFEKTSVHWIDLSLIGLYLVVLLITGLTLSRRISSGKDYFLAGKSLPWWIIGLSIIGTNIGSNDYVGASGGAYRIGIAQANFEWIGAIPAMILAAFLFIPFYWRAGVYSIPEYLGMRYNQIVRVISATVLVIFSIMIVGVFLWATALMLQTYLGWPIWFSIFLTAIVVGFYTVSGGLKAVTITDSLQMLVMVGGSIGLAYLGISQAGGFSEFVQHIETHHPDHLSAFLPADHPEFPWPGVILGLALVLSPAYWCANQAVLQRTLAARSQWDGQASMIFAAMAKTFVPFLIILPGFLALVLNPDVLEHSDQALPWIIRHILPPGLSGLLFVAFIAALQSSVDSTLNSASTMVTRDIYGVISGKSEDQRNDLKMGRIITLVGLILGVFLAPITAKFTGIYVFVQQMLSFFQGPIFALILFGILSTRPTARAGLHTLLTGLCFSALLGYMQINMLYIAFSSFLFSTVILFLLSFFTEEKKKSDLENLTIHTTASFKERKPVNTNNNA